MIKFNKDMIVDEVLNRCPESYNVMVKYFGSDCFLYPELKMESIDTNAKITGVDPNKIIKAINMLIH